MIMFSAFVAIFLYFPPILLLIIYPTSLYRKISDRIRPRWRIGIKIYVETYQGCYKDSTNGTRDYRAISGYSLIVPGISLLMLQIITIEDSFTIDNNLLQYGLFMIVMVFIILCSLMQPYKQNIANVSAVAILVILGAIFTLSTGLHGQYQTDLIRIMIITLMFLPHCGLGVYLLWKMNIFKACYNKYKRLWCEESDGMVENATSAPFNLVDSALN